MEKSHIQWTDNTWNPWHGCRKVSPGCKFCYMFRDKERYGLPTNVIVKSKTRFNEPLKWREPKKVFTCSWSDFFIEEADEWRQEAWKLIKNTPQHTYQILTKRPERILENLPNDWGSGYENVWLGVSVETQEMADKRIPILLNVPAAVKWLSCEPLLGKVNLDAYINYLQWIVVGGESGNKTGKYLYRECELEWIREINRSAVKNNVPVFIKQLGTHLAKELKLKDRHGGNVDEFPIGFGYRNFPQ